jgi:hypothetical protein
MPKLITPAMRAPLDEEATRLAAIWRITRKDGQQFFFTDHDRDIAFGRETYRADAGFARTAIRSDAGFADNLDLVGVFAKDGIVEGEVRAGLFDGAEIGETARPGWPKDTSPLPFDAAPSELAETNDQPHLAAQPGCCL